MDYLESVEYINTHTGRKSPHGSLDDISELLRRLGNPHEGLEFIHVAGTNGKGSTCAYVESILRFNNYKTGLFTSPFIKNINERIRINNENISDEAFTIAANTVRKHVDKMEKNGVYTLSFFKILTAIAFIIFKEENIDIAVIEVGIGGTYDSTNVINPLLSIITSIGYDHMKTLGSSIDEIAQNKAGIIKKNTPVVLAPQLYDESYAVILNQALNKSAPVFNLDSGNIIIESHGISGSEFIYNYGDSAVRLSTSLIGTHQVINASLGFLSMVVFAQSTKFNLDLEKIKAGIKSVKWYGRCEVISKKPLIIVDGAHNEQSLNALIAAVRLIYPIGKLNVIFAVKKGKEYSKMLKSLSKIAKMIYLADGFSNSFVPSDELQDELNEIKIPNEIIGNLEDTIYHIVKTDNTPLVVCGSLYMTHPAKENILKIISN